MVRFFSAMDDTHLMWGREFPGESHYLWECSNALGGFSWAAGGDNHKLQGGAQSPHDTGGTTVTRCTASQGEPGLEAHTAFLVLGQLAVTPLRLCLCRWTCLAPGSVPTLPFNMHPGRYCLIWNSQ